MDECPAHSQQQLLRSGRGDGYRAALAASATEDVVACVIDDPRWDRQLESREGYYASLLNHLKADVTPIVERILALEAVDEPACWLPVGVLVQLARRHHPAAGAGLARCVREGKSWRSCLDALDAAGGEALVGAVIQAQDIAQLLHVTDVEELARATQVVQAPWEAWARTVPALRFIAVGRATRTAEPVHFTGPLDWMAHRLSAPDSTEPSERSTVAELLQAATEPGPLGPIVAILARRDDSATELSLRFAARGDDPRQRAAALRALGLRGCADYVDDACQFLSAQTRQSRRPDQALLRTSYILYLQTIAPQRTLPLARDWLFGAWPLSHAAEEIFSVRSTFADLPLLEAAGKAALGSGDMYRLGAMVDALAHVGAAESVPFLCEAYCSASYSLARRKTISALLPHAGHAAVQALIVEALWDCEAESRELASGAVRLDHLAAARRLKEMAADRFEDPAVREAATRHA